MLEIILGEIMKIKLALNAQKIVAEKQREITEKISKKLDKVQNNLEDQLKIKKIKEKKP